MDMISAGESKYHKVGPFHFLAHDDYGTIHYNNRSITPLFHVPPSQLHTLFCPKLNHYLFGKSFCLFSEGQVVCMRTCKCVSAWMEKSIKLFIGAQNRGNMRVNLRQDAKREEKKNTSYEGFSYSFTDFSCWSSKLSLKSLSNSQTVQSLFWQQSLPLTFQQWLLELNYCRLVGFIWFSFIYHPGNLIYLTWPWIVQCCSVCLTHTLSPALARKKKEIERKKEINLSVKLSLLSSKAQMHSRLTCQGDTQEMSNLFLDIWRVWWREVLFE